MLVHHAQNASRKTDLLTEEQPRHALSQRPLSGILQAIKLSTHRSPQTRCRLRLGLRPGVLSLCRPAFSSSFNLLDKASASMASETALVEVEPISTFPKDRLVGIVGGVFERGGVLVSGV
jgi:hypothetical protein